MSYTEFHVCGKLYQTGRITKAGRRDLRYTMVEAANKAARSYPHWKAELARLESRLGHSKAIVAIARKLLVAVWHVPSEETADRFADPVQVAKFLYPTSTMSARLICPMVNGCWSSPAGSWIGCGWAAR